MIGARKSSRLRLRRRDQRGVALIMVLAAIMTMTVLVTDISFGARVRSLTSVHSRQQTQAYYLASSGISIYRLILMANAQIARQPMLKSAMESMGIPSGDALWKMIPFINTGLLRMLLVADGGDVEDADAEAFKQSGQVSEAVADESRAEGGHFNNRNFLDFEGDFSVTVRGEDCRVGVNQLASRDPATPVQNTVAGQQIAGLMSGETNDQWLRDRNLDKWDLISNLADWVDTDDIVASGKGSYEDDFYNRRDSPYLSKNAKFDTQSEIQLVEGWQDEVYARFGDQVSIYGGGKIDINCADDAGLRGICLGNITGCNDDMASRFVQAFHEAELTTAFTSGAVFVQWCEANGFTVSNPKLASMITTKNTYFTLTSTGLVGDASARITAVVDQSTDNGKILYWKVD
jgi:type II secretory pathway component PulK